MALTVNIGPRQRWLRVAAGLLTIALALYPGLDAGERILLALVGAGCAASGATGF